MTISRIFAKNFTSINSSTGNTVEIFENYAVNSKSLKIHGTVRTDTVWYGAIHYSSNYFVRYR